MAKKSEAAIGAYMSIGAGVGAALGAALGSIAMGVGLGAAFGVLIGVLVTSRSKTKLEADWQSENENNESK